MLLTKFQWILLVMIVILFVFLLYLVISKARENFQSKDPMLQKIKQSLLKLHPICEDIKFLEGKKSYTINKKNVYLCLKDENGEYYDDNMLMYVAIHELAHVLCDEIGHTEKFHKIFDELLEKSAELGIYNPSIPLTDNYCDY